MENQILSFNNEITCRLTVLRVHVHQKHCRYVSRANLNSGHITLFHCTPSLFTKAVVMLYRPCMNCYQHIKTITESQRRYEIINTTWDKEWSFTEYVFWYVYMQALLARYSVMKHDLTSLQSLHYINSALLNVGLSRTKKHCLKTLSSTIYFLIYHEAKHPRITPAVWQNHYERIISWNTIQT